MELIIFPNPVCLQVGNLPTFFLQLMYIRKVDMALRIRNALAENLAR